ncbi:uncharacterized protein V6R79_002063 [Siganus canaliculatus]
MAELKLVLIGDPDSIEIGPRNILLDHEEGILFRLCCQHISVINMLGQQSPDRVPFKKGIHAFILLLPNGRHSSCYTAAVQWLQRTYGKESLSYLMTVVTHKLNEKCDGAFTDLKANSSFVESRYHTCTRSMMDAGEILDLLEKIDVMVSENNPQCYSAPMCDASVQTEDLDHQSHRDVTDASVIQQNRTVMAEVKLVLIGDPDSIETGARNILLDHEEGILFRLCRQHISVINMLSQQPPDRVPFKKGIHAFILLLPNGRHSSCYTAAVQWLERTYGKESLSYLMTVVTHKLNEKCDGAFTDLKANSSFVESRYHTCTRSMMDAGEILALLGKIDFMVSENSPQCYSGPMCEASVQTEDLDRQSHRDVTDASVIQQNRTDKLQRLHLQDKQQQKMTPADFQKVRRPVKQDCDISEQDVAHTFLHRLMMLDYRARYIPVKQDSPEVISVQTSDNPFDDPYSDTVDPEESENTHVHPMDVQMAVFHCSDSFLKQNIVTKLAKCQYALPLLVPDPVTMDINCPLWTFRQISKTWKTTEIRDESSSVTMKCLPICKAQTALVSFFRLGSLPLSKSQLMNSLINDRHSTFFHRNCPGSTKSRHFMDGVAEIAWYCPAGKPNDSFTDCITFCNLHGDALLTEKQRDLLTEKSSVNVVLVPTLDSKEPSAAVISALCKSPKLVIILIADKKGGAVQIAEGKYKIGLKDQSQSDVSEEMKRIIRNILSGPHASFQLENMADVLGIKVDEDNTVCQKGKSAAQRILNLLHGKDVSKVKGEFLSCQGELWHSWSRTNKELYRLTGNIEKEKSAKQEQLMEIRQKQCAASCSELMKLFIESLSSFRSADREYFLKWTQIFLDNLSTDDLSSILDEYDHKWSEVEVLKKKHDKSDELKKTQKELEQISAELQSATFGVEYIFREMGQIYEAHEALQKRPERVKTDWSKYPELAADLMISGHPMELMDGDAGHVPLKWISSLLDEVIQKLGDKKVFVLSILGLRSSGKSTTLNAMFGLQFAVSAGRRTKGACMQLVTVSEEMKEELKFDYVLVVDTEGLRALELAGTNTVHHDNELATFVVGLGNMTLINIFGENPSDMQDVLQIVVQAFMRMKGVKLSPSCVFVHQNVTDISAAEKNMDGKRRLQEKLDQMTKLSAKEEVCDAECFSDIIEFDVQKDVKYFAQLWEGSPPMAPPNPGYSESIQDLKSYILSKASQTAGISLTHFKSKVQDLWNALLNENFVFSFKNTLEISVYRKLEVQYGNWTWAIRSKMLEIKNQRHTEIENGRLEKVHLSHLHKEMKETFKKVETEIKSYFDYEKDKDMLVQWQRRFEVKITDFLDEQVRGVKRKLDEVIDQKKALKNMDEKKTEFENKLLQKSKELAHQLKDKAKDEEELKKQFSSVWSDWVTELTAGTKSIDDINFEEDQTTIIQHLGFEWSLINDRRLKNNYKNMLNIGDYSDYVVFKSKEQRIRRRNSILEPLNFRMNPKSLQHEDQQLIKSFIDDVEQKCLVLIKAEPVATRGYSPAYLQKMANTVKSEVATFQSTKKEYVLKKEFTVDLLLFVFHRAEKWLTESHKIFQKNNDALIYLESKKDQYFNIFRSFCKGSSSAVVFGQMICDTLKVSAVEAVCNKTAMDLADEMKSSVPAFSGNRSNLEKYVMKSLAEKENFQDFMTYIHHPKERIETFIREEVEKYIFRDRKDTALEILKKNVDDIKQFVTLALFQATEKVKTQKGNINMWVEEFSSSLRKKLTFNIDCQNFQDINNFDFLKEEIEKGLEPIMTEMRSHSLKKLKEFRMKPDQILIDQLCDCCWVKCPFCAAVCTNTLKYHDGKHSVTFHQSAAVKGWHYTDTDEFSLEFCTTNIASDRKFRPHHASDERIPYKEYYRGGPQYSCWSIPPDESKLPYWKWFVCRFEKQLEDHYKLKFKGRGEIPDDWRKHSKENAVKILDIM